MLQAKLIGWALSALALLGIIYGVYHYGRHVEGLEWEAKLATANQKNEDAAKKLALEYTNKLITAEGNHNEAIQRVAVLTTKLNRVSVVLPTRSCPIATTATEASPSINVPRGMAYTASTESVGDSERQVELQSALDEARHTIDTITQQCAALNLDAIRLNASR